MAPSTSSFPQIPGYASHTVSGLVVTPALQEKLLPIKETNFEPNVVLFYIGFNVTTRTSDYLYKMS
jgi:hypothetical protein